MKRLIIFILLTASFCACDKKILKDSGKDPKKPLAWGQKTEVYAFADVENWEIASSAAKAEIEQKFMTTEPEAYFKLNKVGFEQIDSHYKYRNLLFVATLSEEGKVNSYVKERLDKKTISSVEENGAGVFVVDNLWANDQLVVFILAKDRGTLTSFIFNQQVAANFGRIFKPFKERLDKRVGYTVFGRPLHAKRFFKDEPYTLNLPENYKTYKRGKNFASYLNRNVRENKDQYLSVYYEKLEPSDYTAKWVVATRQKLAFSLYDEDTFLEDDIQITGYNWHKQSAIKLMGRWQNAKHLVGGAFCTYSYYDKKNKVAYLLDTPVYYPGGEKIIALLELEIISRTFVLKDKEIK